MLFPEAYTRIYVAPSSIAAISRGTEPAQAVCAAAHDATVAADFPYSDLVAAYDIAEDGVIKRSRALSSLPAFKSGALFARRHRMFPARVHGTGYGINPVLFYSRLACGGNTISGSHQSNRIKIAVCAVIAGAET